MHFDKRLEIILIYYYGVSMDFRLWMQRSFVDTGEQTENIIYLSSRVNVSRTIYKTHRCHNL